MSIIEVLLGIITVLLSAIIGLIVGGAAGNALAEMTRRKR